MTLAIRAWTMGPMVVKTSSPPSSQLFWTLLRPNCPHSPEDYPSLGSSESCLWKGSGVFKAACWPDVLVTRPWCVASLIFTLPVHTPLQAKSQKIEHWNVFPKFAANCHQPSLHVVDRFCDSKWDNVYGNHFYHKLIDINRSSVPMASHQHYNETTLNKMMLFADLL